MIEERVELVELIGQAMSNEFVDPSGRAADMILTAGYRPINASDELWAAVKAKAAQQNTTASETIRELLKEWLGTGSRTCGCGDADE